MELEKEWQVRYKHTKRHKSVEMLLSSELAMSLQYIGLTGKSIKESLSNPQLCMPEHCKISSDPVESYREYYRTEKKSLHKWKNREVPHWL